MDPLEDEVQEQRLTPLERITCATAGVVAGLFPPRLQLKFGEVTSNAYDAATIMSTSSRVVNGLAGMYGLAFLLGKVIGADIDPTPENTWGGVGVAFAADSTLREMWNGMCYIGRSDRKYNAPWGEPVVSFIDWMRHEDDYHGGNAF